MRHNSPTRFQLLLVFLASTIPRIAGAIWLPNAFGDAYAYTEQIYYLRRALLDGSFSVSSLFGFWLPLYQVICAGVSAVTGNPFYIPKLISAISGGGVCVLVCALTWTLTFSRWLTWVTTAIVAVNPYHIFYSSSAMTDVPHTFFILLCAYCCIEGCWWLASVCALSAGLMRIESWTLIPLIPLAQLLNGPDSNLGRRVLRSIALFLCLTAGPLFWLYVSWKATGSFGKYFEIRNQYIVETLAGNAWLNSFSAARVVLDLSRLIYTANPVVIYLALLLLSRGMLTSSEQFFARCLSWLRNLLGTAQGLILTFFCSHLAFLLIAYLSNNQPEIWPRYGLIFFALGLPLFASQSRRAWNCSSSEQLSTTVLGRREAWPIYATALLFAVQFCLQLVDVTRMTVKSDPNLTVAEFLEDQHKADRTMKVYCDDGAIRVLSGIPLEEFKNQYNSPADEKAFIQSLRDQQVRFLVYKDLPGSRLREIIRNVRASSTRTGIILEEVVPTPRKLAKDSVVVYRIHEGEMANGSLRSTRTKLQRH